MKSMMPNGITGLERVKPCISCIMISVRVAVALMVLLADINCSLAASPLSC
jgi:hypothetical protein